MAIDSKYMVGILNEYGEQALEFNWVNPETAAQKERERMLFLTDMGATLDVAYNKTKPHLGPLSKGCRLCGDGTWSCLFINGRCNCDCFFCPTSQDDTSVPTTNRIPFSKAKDYADYVEKIGFKGVSISGGEPLITFKRTMQYIEAVRRRMGDAFYIWLYTNGTLLKEEHISAFQSLGLNEIRFDLSAVNYDLTKVKLAAGKIPCVTVEIPAVPEDHQTLLKLLPAMVDTGVNHLNLHQLRMTPHNSAKVLKRNYTFIKGEKVTVLESELKALLIMRHAVAECINLPINYCSFVYKRRYQQTAVRRRNAPYLTKGYESLTNAGFIRALALAGQSSALSNQAERFCNAGENSEKWLLSTRSNRLYFHQSLWPLVDFNNFELSVNYADAVLLPHVTYMNAFKEIRLNQQTKLYVEKQPRLVDEIIPVDEREAYIRYLDSRTGDNSSTEDKLPKTISDFEVIPSGLQVYF